MKGNWLNAWVNFTPLFSPILADFIRPLHKAAFKRFWPSHIGSH